MPRGKRWRPFLASGNQQIVSVPIDPDSQRFYRFQVQYRRVGNSNVEENLRGCFTTILFRHRQPGLGLNAAIPLRCCGYS